MKKSILLLLLICLGCAPKPNNPSIQITLIDNNKNLKISGLDYAVMQEINRDTTSNIWQSLIPIYRMPADTDMKDYQPIQPGKYMIRDSAVVFTPDTPFFKHQTYFVRYYNFNIGTSTWDYIKNNQKPGKKAHIDLIFKQ
jgi:hypothetical protein